MNIYSNQPTIFQALQFFPLNAQVCTPLTSKTIICSFFYARSFPPSYAFPDAFAMYLYNGLLLDPSSKLDISDSNDSFETMGNFFHFLFGCLSSTDPWMTNFILRLPPPLFCATFSLVGVALVARGAFYLIGVLFFACVPLSVIVMLFTSIDINLVVVLPLHTFRALPLLCVVCHACASKDYTIIIVVRVSFNTPTFNCTSYSWTNSLL